MTDLKASSLRALKLMDLTTLNDDDTDEKVIACVIRPKLRSVIPPLSVSILALSRLLAKR